MSGSDAFRGRVLAGTALAAWLAIGAGAFQPYYARIHTQDREALRIGLTELPYRQIPGLRTLLADVDRSTPRGARILIALPHREWQRGYGYGFRRAQYALEGKVAIPLLNRETDRLDPHAIDRADYVACWGRCEPPPGFVPLWQSRDGMLLRRAR
jgi:hypothetical protein